MNLYNARKTSIETIQETEDEYMQVENPEPVVCEETLIEHNPPPRKQNTTHPPYFVPQESSLKKHLKCLQWESVTI